VIEFSSEKLRKLRDEICQEHGWDPLSHQFHVFGLSPEGAAQRGGGRKAGEAVLPKPPATPLTSPFAKPKPQ
jgi:hypothetical protein